MKKENFIKIVLLAIPTIFLIGFSYDVIFSFKMIKAFYHSDTTLLSKYLPSISEETLNQIKNQGSEKVFMFYISNTILASEILFLLIFNILFYFPSTRKKLFNRCRKYNLFFDSTQNINTLKMNILRTYIFLFQIYCGVNFLSQSFYSLIPFIGTFFFISQNPFVIKKKHIFMILPLIYSLMVAKDYYKINSSLKKEIPSYFSEETKKLIKQNYGNNVYTSEGETNILLFIKRKLSLIFSNDFSSFNPDEINALVGHEIGHGNIFTNAFFLFLRFFLGLILGYLFYKLMVVYSSQINEATYSKEIIQNFLFLVNFTFFMKFLSFGNSFVSQVYEIMADKKAVNLGYKNELAVALIKLTLLSGDYVFRPFFTSLVFYSHPSTYLRTLLLNYY